MPISWDNLFRLQTLLSFLDWFGRIWIWLGAAAIGGVGYYLAVLSEFLDQWAPLSYFSSALISALLFTLSVAAVAKTALWFAQRKSQIVWSEQVEFVNPMDPSFTGVRIRIGDLVSPITNSVRDKNFQNCELIGRINLLFYGRVALINTSFTQSDFCLLSDVRRGPSNVAVFQDCTFTNCSFTGVTVFAHPSQREMFESVQGHYWLCGGSVAVDS